MRYMLLIYTEGRGGAQAGRERCSRESRDLAQQLKSKGQCVDSSQLQPVVTATSIRVREGKRTTTDGAFVETREQLGGYFIVEVKDLDEAIGIAGQIPAARCGTVEIRPILEVAGLSGN